MTPFEAKLYETIKANPRLTYGDAVALLWPGHEDTVHKRKALSVHVCKLNKQLPAGERIEAIRTTGYQFTKVDSQNG